MTLMGIVNLDFDTIDQTLIWYSTFT